MHPKQMAETSILVVDEDPQVRNLLQRVLQRQCGLLESAVDAQEAQQLCARCHFDLLITDYCAPQAGEPGWLKQVRARNTRMDVILLTSRVDLGKLDSMLKD